MKPTFTPAVQSVLRPLCQVLQTLDSAAGQGSGLDYSLAESGSAYGAVYAALNKTLQSVGVLTDAVDYEFGASGDFYTDVVDAVGAWAAETVANSVEASRKETIARADYVRSLEIFGGCPFAAVPYPGVNAVKLTASQLAAISPYVAALNAAGEDTTAGDLESLNNQSPYQFAFDSAGCIYCCGVVTAK